jgi:dolichol-phosphate mannosyltransferase
MTLLIVLPTYNERPNLELVAAGILAHSFTRLLVVDDASPDGTGAIADAIAAGSGGRVEVMHRTGPRGLGRAYIDGLSHDPKYLPELVAALDDFDLVIGSRYLHGVSVVNWPLRRIVLSAFANRYIRAITGLGPHDCTSGFRVWRREALARLPIETARTSGYAFLTEMLFTAARAGCRIGEVPIVFVERREGASKVSSGVLLESLVTPWRLSLGSGRISRPR